MGYGYYYEPDFGAGSDAVLETATGAAAFLLVFVGVFLLIALAVGVVFYVLRAVGIYTIAKRRGIHNPWLAWLPIGDAWVIGSISDQYQYLVKGKITSRRNILVWLSIGEIILAGIYGVLQAATVIGAINGSGAAMGAGSASALLVSLFMMILSVVYMVFTYIALYDLYHSCDPDNVVIHLLLSILLPVSLPILLFVCRGKDLGMPARIVHQEPPVYHEPPAYPQDPPVYPYG